MNSGAFTGDHSEQLEDIFKEIVKSEQIAGKELTPKEVIDIRYDISKAYDEIINCFDKENADASIIDYAINLMKSTVATTSDLKNISQIAVAVSQSTIGALYLVNHLEEREKEKLGVLGLVEENDENKKNNEILEELTEKIEVNIAPEIFEEITSEKNEKAYNELMKRATNGDEKANIAINLIRKSANFISNNQTGRLNADKKDLAALVLVGKIAELGEDIALLSANQLIREFGLERYDIFDQDENGNSQISHEKIKSVLQKEFGKKGMNLQAELILGLEREQANIGSIEQLNKAAESKSKTSLLDVHMLAKKNAEIATFRAKLFEISKCKNEGVIMDYESCLDNFVENNRNTAKNYLKYAIEFSNLYLTPEKSPEIYYRITEVSSALKRESKDNLPNNYKKGFYTNVENSEREEQIEKDMKKYENYIELNQMTPSDDEER